MKLKMKKTCLATMLALGTMAQAERMVVTYSDNGNGLIKFWQKAMAGLPQNQMKMAKMKCAVKAVSETWKWMPSVF